MTNPKFVETNKQLAALRQIHSSISLFRYGEGEYESAITLAAAAEGLLPKTEDPHLFKILSSSPFFKELDPNLFINWLKHPTQPEEAIIGEFEATIIIVRAISKYLAIYKNGSKQMRNFVNWAFDEGHLPKPNLEE